MIRERWLNAPTNAFADTLTERTFDARGRVVATTDNNLGRLRDGLAALPVDQTFAYDGLNRVTEQTVTLAGEQYVTTSDWIPVPGSGWQRELTYPTGKVVTRSMDELGRLDTIAVDGRLIDFRWIGELYAGRDHDWAGDPNVDLMTESVTLDGLGRGVRLQTDMLDHASGPLNAAWADEYCQGAYDPSVCGEPLFAQDVRRDAVGRARTVQTTWGNPARVVPAQPWRGYAYDTEGQLTTVYEHEGLTESVAELLPRHEISNADIADLFIEHNDDTAEPILAVDWAREDKVGALLSVKERGTGLSRWNHQGPREPGHQLGTIELDGATFAITHDAHGRVVDGAGSVFVYGPRGRLISVTRGNLTEDFAYDASGRLARLEDGKTQHIVHDGDQMIAAMEPGLLTPQWEAVWGGQIDQLLEFERFELGLSGLFIPVTDHRNSIVGWWNADTRQMKHILEYTPLGRLRVLAPDGTQRCVEEGTGNDCAKLWSLPPFGFASAYRSEVSAISYMRNRWYAPKLGQFLTHDPLGYIDAFNPYSYGVHDPINYWDPYGLAGNFLAGIKLGFEDKVGEFFGDIWNGLNWLSESLFSNPIGRKLEDAALVKGLLEYFAENPEQLLEVLPFGELGAEGLLGKEALKQRRFEDAGRHIYKALLSVVLDLGGAGIVAKIAKAAGFNALAKRFHVEEYGGPGSPPEWSKKRRLREAGPGTQHGLPGGRNESGPFRFRPPADYNPTNPLPKGPNNGYLDRFGNEWVRGDYHGDPKLGFEFEWDVQLTPEGVRHWNKRGDAVPAQGGGFYLNVRPDGHLSH